MVGLGVMIVVVEAVLVVVGVVVVLVVVREHRGDISVALGVERQVSNAVKCC